jgi:hypothetical protein
VVTIIFYSAVTTRPVCLVENFFINNAVLKHRINKLHHVNAIDKNVITGQSKHT